MSKTSSMENRSDMSFEQGMVCLEAIVERLEKEEMPLDKMVELFEEGVKLSRYCRQKLDQLQGRINVIIKENETVGEKPFTLPEGEE